MLRLKRLPVFAIDSFLIIATFLLSFLIRFDFKVPAVMWLTFVELVPIVFLLKAAVFVSSGMYKNLWRYASLQDGFTIFKVVSLSSLATLCVIKFFPGLPMLPRSILVFDFFLLLLAVACSRVGWRMYREMYLMPKLAMGRRTLIVGAGQAGSLLLKEIRQQPLSRYNVIGFVDDDIFKVGLALHGVPVVGKTSQLKALIRKYCIEKVIIAIPSAPRKVIGDIIKSCEKGEVKFKILPGITDILAGKVSVSQIKDVEIEDLLGREPINLDEGAISRYLSQKVVLVTGAAGSIGSEVCRQVARFGPERLILFDNAETPLYYIEKELVTCYPELRIVPVIGDVRNVDRVDSVFDDFQPDVVFHAAAYKHVPMMEYNPAEAVTNNIGGTKNVADAADRHNVGNFVMVSTDKAVNPTNVMGATKRAAEIYVQALARKSSTKFTTVRFGNVLGSNGSVIPLFKEQIKNGGPLTVTDPKIIRYFMTIPEATQLVLQAGCIGDGGEIFVLDMGEPVKIVELAEQLIRLSGLTPYEDIDIVFTGLRPGEKLFEELLISGEGIKPTSHNKIKVLESLPNSMADVCCKLDSMFGSAQAADVNGVLLSLYDLVPEFVHQNKIYAQLCQDNAKKASGAVVRFPRASTGA